MQSIHKLPHLSNIRLYCFIATSERLHLPDLRKIDGSQSHKALLVHRTPKYKTANQPLLFSPGLRGTPTRDDTPFNKPNTLYHMSWKR